MKLVINRKIWLHGEGASQSALLRSEDGKMCCLGFFAKACGATDDEIEDRNMMYTDVMYPKNNPNFYPFMKSSPNAIDVETPPQAILDRLATTNDGRFLSDEDRERYITEDFASFGVEVVFKGRYPVVDRGI